MLSKNDKTAINDLLIQLEARLDKKFATKDDLVKLKTDILIELSKTRSQIVGDLGDLIQDKIIPMFDNRDERLDRHHRRLNKLEQVNGLPVSTDD